MPGKTTSVTLDLAPISAYHFSPDGAGSFAEIVVHRRLEGTRPMRLVVGDKNRSARAMGPWVLLTEFGLPFEELAAGADVDDAPVLVDDGGLVVRDTPAIAEFLAVKFPALALWPRDARQRTRARALCAELHAGCGARPADLARVSAPWQAALAASGGPFLFGGYSIADACCAPIALRLRTHASPPPADIAAYVDRLVATRGVAAWIRAAQAARPFDARG